VNSPSTRIDPLLLIVIFAKFFSFLGLRPDRDLRNNPWPTD
jgi:hypothetical protein